MVFRKVFHSVAFGRCLGSDCIQDQKGVGRSLTMVVQLKKVLDIVHWVDFQKELEVSLLDSLGGLNYKLFIEKLDHFEWWVPLVLKTYVAYAIEWRDDMLFGCSLFLE